MDVAVQCIDNYVDAVNNLPLTLKSKLLTAVSRRGTLKTGILKSLIHADVTALDFSESDICDDTINAISQCSQLRKLDLNPGRNQVRELSPSG